MKKTGQTKLEQNTSQKRHFSKKKKKKKKKLVGYFIHFFCDEWDKSFFISGSNAVNGGKTRMSSETAQGSRNLDGE